MVKILIMICMIGISIPSAQAVNDQGSTKKPTSDEFKDAGGRAPKKQSKKNGKDD